MTREQAEGFYAVHKARPFFADLVKFMISGPVMVQALEGEGARLAEASHGQLDAAAMKTIKDLEKNANLNKLKQSYGVLTIAPSYSSTSPLRFAPRLI